ncbi:MAG: hypothetical protein R2823_06785 [Acidimicrobiia bacterium]
MIGPLLLSGILAVAPPNTDGMAPGDGIGLAPNPTVRSHQSVPVGVPRPWHPMIPVSTTGVVLAAAGAVTMYRRRRTDPLVVVVHGDGGSVDDFSFLIEAMEIDPSRVVAFDYSTVDGGPSSAASSHHVRTDAAAAELDGLLRGLAEDNANIYSIHHSRGGAVGAEMIAAIDAGERPRIDGYRGAALLDPAIASGGAGVLQSVGARWAFGFLPDDGDFSPTRCDAAGCRDVRDHLGDHAGVEVLVIRNRDAVVTNFPDQPDGLRVLDLDDGRGSAWLYPLLSPLLFVWRVQQAHRSVLVSDAVAACVRAEIDHPGSCEELGDD